MPHRYLIGHMGRSMLVPDSNTGLGGNARLLGGSFGHLMLVAEGFGRLADAEAAAEAAASAMARQFVDGMPSFFGQDVGRESELKTSLEAVVARCQRSVLERGQVRGGAAMGTSLTTAYVLWPRMYVMHLGDCRCYLVRDGEARQVTTDHVRHVPSRRTRDGREDEAPGSQALLTNALGTDMPRPTLEYSRVDLQDEDTVVLCTSGLTEALGDGRGLARTVGRGSAQSAVEALMGDAGGEDGRRQGAARDAAAVVVRFRRGAPDLPREQHAALPAREAPRPGRGRLPPDHVR